VGSVVAFVFFQIFDRLISIRPRGTHNIAFQKCPKSHRFLCAILLVPIFFGDPKYLDLDYHATPTSNHLAWRYSIGQESSDISCKN